jgi:hypothetical protein
MKTTFYEILLVPAEADAQMLQHAYEQTLSTLTKRLRAARQRGLDTTQLEDERVALEDAWRVLSDPVRRARYDRFLQLSNERPAQEADELWARVSPALLDPAAEATLELVGMLTGLAVGHEPRRAAAVPAPAPPPPVVARTVTPASARPAAPRPAAQPTPKAQPPQVRVAPPATAPAARPAPASGPQARQGPSPAAGPAVIAMPTQPRAAQASAPAPEPAAADLPTLIFELGYSGALIKRLREAEGLSLDDLASSTRIAKRYLEAIEADEFTRLPAATFVRGYLRSVARLLGVDPERLSGGYLARMGR